MKVATACMTWLIKTLTATLPTIPFFQYLIILLFVAQTKNIELEDVTKAFENLSVDTNKIKGACNA
jgi:hypothetical protein